MKPFRSLKLPVRGAVLLVVVFLLLFLMALVALYMNRSLLFEQKASASLARSTRAFELAEAGLEWGIAGLNNPLLIDASCQTPATATTNDKDFRTRYTKPTALPTRFDMPPNSRAGCTVDPIANTLSCSCPPPATPAAALNLGLAERGRFMVEFRPVTDPVTNVVTDPLAVEVVAHGCTSADPQCGDSSGSADATAVSRSLIKLVGTFGRAPPSSMTAGGAITVSGSLTVVNTDHASNGITINSGSTLTPGSGTRVVTLPGTPPALSILDNDLSLSQLSQADADGDRYFQSFFSSDMEAFRNQPLTKVITASDCSGANDCGRLVSSYIDAGYQQFWVYPDITFTNANLPLSGTLGMADRPIYFASAGNFELKSSVVAYGLFYAANASATENWDYTGSGSATVFGAFVSRGAFDKGSGTLNLIYNPLLFGLGGGSPTGMLVRVPGSWRDF